MPTRKAATPAPEEVAEEPPPPSLEEYEAAQKAAAEAAAVVPERDPSICVNCGKPSVWKTTFTGANTDYFCEDHAVAAYGPDHPGLEKM